MSYDPNWPPFQADLAAADFRAQFQGLKALIDAVFPIGCVAGHLKGLGGVPALPGLWLECNGQTVNDPDSPLNGVTLPDLNGAQGGPPSFLRGAAASGGTGGGETHTHAVDLNVNGGLTAAGTDVTVFPPGSYNTAAASSLPTYHEVVWAVRVK